MQEVAAVCYHVLQCAALAAAAIAICALLQCVPLLMHAAKGEFAFYVVPCLAIVCCLQESIFCTAAAFASYIY